MKNKRSMSIQLLKLLVFAGICSASLLVIVLLSSDYLIQEYFSGSELQSQMVEKRIENFGEYILINDISATDKEELMSWCNKQPMVLMEIYRDNILYFNSNYNLMDPLTEQNIEIPRYSWYSYYEMQFADGPADVLVYSDESYILNTWVTICTIVISGILFITIVLMGIRKTIHYIYLLCDEIQIMGSGDLKHPVTIRDRNELSQLAEELDQMRSALYYHQQKERDMIKRNNDMIAGLSHDLRTPMTKLMIYTEIIQSNRCSDKKQLDKYLARIHDKAVQMKDISEHLMKYSLSKETAGQPIMQTESFCFVFFDRLSELIDYLSEQGFDVKCNIDWAEMQISYNDLFLDRILDNIVSNIEKYADRSYPVEISSACDDCYTGISVKNKKKLYHYTKESSGVGIKNIREMMRYMNGKIKVDHTKTVFEISLLFQKIKAFK